MLMHIVALIYRFYNLMISNVAKNHRISSSHGSQFEAKHNRSNLIANMNLYLLEIVRKPHIQLCRWKNFPTKFKCCITCFPLVRWLVGLLFAWFFLPFCEEKKNLQNVSQSNDSNETNSCGFCFYSYKLRFCLVSKVWRLVPIAISIEPIHRNVLRFVCVFFSSFAHMKPRYHRKVDQQNFDQKKKKRIVHQMNALSDTCGEKCAKMFRRETMKYSSNMCAKKNAWKFIWNGPDRIKEW